MNSTFTIEQKPLFTILSSMQPICNKRTTIEASSSILFHVGHKELVLKSTDLEISLQASYLLKDSSFFEPVSFLVSGKRLFDIVKELEHTITCTKTDNQLMLSAGKVHVALNIKDAQEFPPFPERIENLMQFDASMLQDMFNKVSFLIPQNNANPALNGLYLEITKQGSVMTATDGHCLVQINSSQYALEEEKKWLLPRRAIFELKKLLETYQEKVIFLGVCGNQVVFSGDTFNFFTKVLADPFPQYTTVLDKTDFVPARLDRSHFIKTLRRSASLLSGQFLATQFRFEPALLHVNMQNSEVGTLAEELPLHDFSQPEIAIRFYAPYLLSGLQVFPHDQVNLYLKNASRPIIFETKEDVYSLLYLVMPVAATHQASQ
jgi:DNA polymerase III beta subunit